MLATDCSGGIGTASAQPVRTAAYLTISAAASGFYNMRLWWAVAAQREQALAKQLSIGFVALGCVKNLVDSEKMLAQLAEGGCLVGADLPQADVIVVNTCGFLAAARAEAHQAIREAVHMKRAGRCRRVVVAGCLVQRDGQALLDQVPGIDALVGVHNRQDLLKAVGHPSQWPSPSRRKKSRRQPDLFLGEYHPHSRPACDSPRGTSPTCASAKGATRSAPSAPSRPFAARCTPRRPSRFSTKPAS